MSKKNNEPLQVFIGTENNQLLPQKVLEYSLKKNSSVSLKVTPLYQTQKRVGGTNFGFVRFTIPEICNFKGMAIYLDADQIVLDDINKLMSLLNSDKAIGLVNNPQGYFGKKVVAKHNQTSVMVLNCEKLKNWKTTKIFNNVVPNRADKTANQIFYRDFMTLSWEDASKIQAISPYWNHFNIVNKNTKLVHFSHVRSQPWKNVSHELTKFWAIWLKEAIKNKAVSRITVLLEIIKGNVDRHFLRYLF
jgi:lipopolysaccharide biosynthesis glycosyltransferase